jgi:hypothetical protein
MYYNLICIFICTPMLTKFNSCKKWVLHHQDGGVFTLGLGLLSGFQQQPLVSPSVAMSFLSASTSLASACSRNVLASCSQITTSSSSLDLEAMLSWVTVLIAFMVSDAWDSLALASSKILRVCSTSVRALAVAD